MAGYSADDPDADAVLAWTLSGGDARHFRIDQDGELRFRLEPDFESPSDAGGNNVYNLSVHIFDGANMPSLNVTVTVQNVDEPGSIALTSIQPQVGTALTASLSDPDGRLLALVYIVEGFSLVVYEDGTVEELVACAESRHVTALYALHEGEFVPYILGAPDFVNQRFRDLFLEGVPAITALVAKSEGPPAGGPDRDDAARN